MDSALVLTQVVKYVNAASLTTLVVDYFQTIEAEVELVWKSKWGLGKVLFLLARYSAFLDVPLSIYGDQAAYGVPIKICSWVYITTSVSTTFGIGIAEAILSLQVYALWGTRTMLILLLTIYFTVCIIAVVILVIFLRSVRFGQPPSPTILGCFATDGSNIIFISFLLLMVYELVILSLTSWLGVKQLRQSRSPVVIALYRGCILYCICLSLISATNVAVLVAGPPELLISSIPFNASCIALSLLASFFIYEQRPLKSARVNAGCLLTTPTHAGRRRTRIVSLTLGADVANRCLTLGIPFQSVGADMVTS